MVCTIFFQKCKTSVIKTKTPEFIRQNINDGDIYIFKGYLDRKIDGNGNINLVYVIAEVVSQSEKQFSDEELEKSEIQSKKSNLGYKDLDGAIKSKLYDNKYPSIALIYGSTGIVNKDVRIAMKGAVTKYNVSEHRINLSSKEEIISKLEELNSFLPTYDAIAIIRGGGSGLEIFNDLYVARKVLELNPIFITAIGHAEDVTLLGKIADKNFATPTAY
jgi:hypothetical protein